MPKYKVKYVNYYPKVFLVLYKRKWFFFWETIYQTSDPVAMRHCIDSYGLAYK